MTATEMDNMNRNEPELGLDDFILLRDYIHEKSGIFFAENKMYMVKNRLSKRLTELGLKEYKDYFYHVKYDTSRSEFKKLMNLVTTKETSFFRNEPQILSFSEEVLPKLIQEKEQTDKTIRIWSAGCSSGEEPYTLAMMLLEKINGRTGWKLEIIANDISDEVLTKARLGEYRGMTLRNVKPYYLAKYFSKDGDTYQIKPEVKALVKFSQMNLNDERKISMSNIDIVFCRNVMIYFSDEVRKKLVRHFYNILKPGGYFYIGHSESLHGISKAFKLVYLKNALVYCKDTVATGSNVSSSTQTSRRSVLSTNTVTNPGATAAKALELLKNVKKAPAMPVNDK